MKTIVYENSPRAEMCERVLRSSRLADKFSEAIILPIPSSTDGVNIRGTDVAMSDALAHGRDGVLVLGYGLPSMLAYLLRARGATVYDAAEDEEFLLANADLTALATLGIILSDGRRAPSDLRIGVVGYGRIGRCLLRYLLYLGAEVRVYSSRESVRMELSELGIGCYPCVDLDTVSGLDILINTAPARILDALAGFDGDMRIMELASGDNFPTGVKVERYPSLPARAYAESAGRVWAKSAERAILGEAYHG